ncbi:gliding motility-associated C-terminal domain-containing protein [Pedobacter sp. MC2016-05]|uniref:T9SS type B sorting domain-containing protein n=1 Tax=Pedobacter sp. MC2016-05 TaxID=2994474 RepID=UPI0022485F86|nr:gliding motility-associated C-terminal domain-containing protein [Pedobacter sp. MC2016-05]MCX2474599.1 gliding motility-associated C-terminal domain-containing protein [Pedobacter sp. MC2016-05]
MPNPNAVNVSGIYYVNFSNNLGCNKILPIEVEISSKPLLKISNPTAVCFPNKVNISSPSIFAGSDDSFQYKFFEDAAITIPLANPENVTKTGTYYVTATNAQGCSVNGKVNVVINDLPVLVVKDPSEVCYPEKIDLTNPNLFEGSSEQLSYSFYTNEGMTEKLVNPKTVSKSGIYFVKATNPSGCFVYSRLKVTVNPLPTIVLNKPRPIFDNDFIDLTSAENIKGSKDYLKVGYFHDASLSRPIADPTRINKAGIYYISLQNDKGCSVSASIELNILPQPKIVVPTAFTPNKDTNNRLYPFLVSIQKLTSFKVFNKWGILVFQTDLAANGWDGQFKSKMQPLETFSWFAEGIDTFGGKFQTTGKTILIL